MEVNVIFNRFSFDEMPFECVEWNLLLKLALLLFESTF